MTKKPKVGQRVRRNYGQNKHIKGTVTRIVTHDYVRVQWDNLPHRGERMQRICDLDRIDENAG